MFSLACKDLGRADCDFVATGDTKEEAMKKSMGHAVEKHGLDPAELSKMDIWQQAMPFLKEV